MLYGPGSGAGGGGPQWLNGIASALRDMSNSVRRAFSDLMDGTLGQLGNVGQFIGGMLKRAFDYGLMLTPAGFAVYEEEVSGMGSMMVMVADAVYSPDPERYNRLGQMLTMLPEAFAQMSAGEWGSMTVDVIVGIFTGEAGEA
ncbi:MAG TPA: hypothetical protein VHC20_00020, partial [Candidatus Paceibacterota bacterium]|nr:hypothetical protein [Candidatus Paceibacterota bacterium]